MNSLSSTTRAVAQLKHISGRGVSQELTVTDRNRLIVAHLQLVDAVAGHLSRSLPPHADQEDLRQAGVLGLINAAKRYDATCGVSFQTYARFRIRGSMLDSLRELDCASRDERRRLKLVERTSANLAQLLQREPTPDEVASSLGLNPDVVLQTKQAQIRLTPIVMESGDERPISELPSKAASPEQLCIESARRKCLKAAVRSLPPRLRKVIILHYVGELPLAHIATRMGVNASRISQLHQKAVDGLRQRIGDATAA